MRTTLTIDDDVLPAVKGLAREMSISLGAAVSELVRKGIQHERITTEDDGFPVFAVPPDARPITLEDVRKQEDEL